MTSAIEFHNEIRVDVFAVTSVANLYCIVFLLELNTGQIQEGVGEAINGIVKHFHKPEKEVRVPEIPLLQGY